MIYWLARLVVPAFFKLFFRLKVSGKENIPMHGPVIVAANHCSYLDPPVLGVAFAPRRLVYLAKKELFSIPGFGWLIKNLGAIPIVRETPTLGTFKTIFSALSKGKFVLIFPEGTRSRDGNLQPGQPGIGFVVQQSKVPVVPVLIKGTHQALPKNSGRIRFVALRAWIGKPLQFEKFYTRASERGTYQAISDEIIQGIKNLN